MHGIEMETSETDVCFLQVLPLQSSRTSVSCYSKVRSIELQ